MSNSEPRRPAACDPAPVAIADWDDLLEAVRARLRLLVGEPVSAPTHALEPVAAAQVLNGVLECVSALEQLHVTLLHERERLHRS